MKLLKSIFGSRDPKDGKPPVGGGGKPVELTPKLFDAVFGKGKPAGERRRR